MIDFIERSSHDDRVIIALGQSHAAEVLIKASD